MAQQTAVEWFMQNVEKTLPNFIEAWRVEFEQAKQMEKEQIKDALKKGEMQGVKAMNNAHYSSLITAEEYYNRTFKK